MVFKHIIFVVAICIMYTFSYCSSFKSGYFPWTPKHLPTKDYIYCPQSCNDSSVLDLDLCCACGSKHKWELANATDYDVLYLLEVEYVSVNFNANLTVNSFCTCVSKLSKTCNCSLSSDANFQGVIHQNGHLKTFPLNTCNYSRLTYIVSLEIKLKKSKTSTAFCYWIHFF